MQLPGPPLHIALDWAGSPSPQAASCALCTCDWALAKHAGIFVAKSLCPAGRLQEELCRYVGVEPHCVCFECWHFDRTPYLDDEAHILWKCPHVGKARHVFLDSLTVATYSEISTAASGEAMLEVLLNSQAPKDWAALGQFCHSLRQHRGRMRTRLAYLQKLRVQKCFSTRRAAWRANGYCVCRHGVFFKCGTMSSCPCMKTSADPSEWQYAQYMPAYSSELRAIIATRFSVTSFRRLGQIQAEMRKQCI